jgi:hypothetical protein
MRRSDCKSVYSVGRSFALYGRLHLGWRESSDDAETPATHRRQAIDHFGQYGLNLKCECGHTRTAQPQTLAVLAGWNALLADVVKRLRCSQCGRRLAVPQCAQRQSAMAKH